MRHDTESRVLIEKMNELNIYVFKKHLHVMNRILVLSPRASLYEKYEALTCDVVASGQSGQSAIPTRCWPWPWEVGVAANPRHPGGITCCPSPSALLSPGPQKDTAPSAWAPEWTHSTDLNPTRSLQPKVRAPDDLQTQRRK